MSANVATYDLPQSLRSFIGVISLIRSRPNELCYWFCPRMEHNLCLLEGKLGSSVFLEDQMQSSCTVLLLIYLITNLFVYPMCLCHSSTLSFMFSLCSDFVETLRTVEITPEIVVPSMVASFRLS